MKIYNVITAVLLLGLACGCKPGQKNEKQFKGQVIIQDDFSVFTDCNTGKEYWLEDKTGEMAAKYKQIATQPYQQVYFVFEADLLPSATAGAAAAYDNIISVKKVVSVAENSDTTACKLSAQKPVFDCMGENPEWTVTFNKQEVIFKAVSPKDTMAIFPVAEAQVKDSAGVGKLFYFNIPNENFQSIQLIITEKQCTSPSGKVSRFSSHVIFGDLIYNGCAKLKTLPKTDEQNTDALPSGTLSGGSLQK